MISDRYEMVKKLGEGSMGSTWLVFDRKLEMEWAMKSWKLQKNSMENEMEIQTLKVVNSQYFPRIVEAFRENGRQYLVMDRIRGITLEEKIRADGILQEDTAIEMILQLCDALQTLHENTPPVYHLDLKPSNIMLTEDGIRLIDFGSAICGWNNAEAKTGTPGFSSPEQMNGEKVDERSDIYSLGAILFAMLSGKGPGKNRKEDRKRMRKLPREIRQLINHAMDEKKENRFANISELRRAVLVMAEQTMGGCCRRMMRICLGTGFILAAAACGTGIVETLYRSLTQGTVIRRTILVGLVPIGGCCSWFRRTELTRRKRLPCFVEKEILHTSREIVRFFD